MAYIGNLPPSVTNIKNDDIASDAAISISKLDGVTSSSSDLNVLAGADAAGVTGTELQHLNGVTSNIQTQLTAASGGATKGTLTKSFVIGETSTIALSSASTPTASVFVTKEISQVGVTNGDWNVNANDTGYDIEDFAYAEDVTIDTTNSTATLASSSWAADDVGKKIVGGGGEAVLLDTAGTVSISNLFNTANPTLTSGNWKFYGVEFASGQGVSLVRGDGAAATSFDFSAETVFRDIQTLNYDTSFQSGSALRVRFNNDGTKIFLLYTNGLIHFANLTNPYDLSIDTLTKGSLTLTATADDFVFNSDGTKLITLGTADNTIREYTLGSAYNLSTITAGPTFSTSQQTTGAASSFTLSGDDSTILVLDKTLEQVFQYEMTIAGDISTMSFSGKSLNVGSLSGQEITSGYVAVSDIDTNPDFTQLYVMTRENSYTVSQYIRTYKYTSTNDVGSAKIQVGSARISNNAESKFVVTNNGRNLYTHDTTYSIFKYQISTPYKLLNNLSGYNNVAFEINESHFEETLAFFDRGGDFQTFSAVSSKDGNYGIYVIHSALLDDAYLVLAPLADKYRLDSPDLASATEFLLSSNITTWNAQYVHAVLSGDGTKIIISSNNVSLANLGYLAQYTMTTPYDLSTATRTDHYTGEPTTPAWDLSPDGTRLYYTGRYNDLNFSPGRIYQFNLTTPFDLSSKSINTTAYDAIFDRPDDARYIYSNDWTTNVARTAGADMFACMDNSRIFIHSSYSAYTHSAIYTMTTTGDITTASIASPFDFVGYDTRNAFELSGPGSYSGIVFNDTGNEAYIATGNNTTPVNHVTFPGAYQIFDYSGRYNLADNASLYYLLGQNTISMALKPDESKSYHLDDAGLITEYSFGTIPHGLVEATASGSTFSATTHETTPTTIKLNDTGTLLFVAGNSTDSVHSYILTSAYDLSTATTTNYKSFSLASEVDSLQSVVFSSDGLKMYALDATTKSVYQYGLSSPYDLDSAAYESKSFDLDVNTLTWNDVLDLYINSTDNEIVVLGTQLAAAGSPNLMGILVSYTLATSKDVSTAYLKGYKALARSSYVCLTVESTGNRAYVGNNIGVDAVSISRNLVNASVAPIDQYLSAITSSINQIDTEYWTDINSMTALNTIQNNGNAYFAISTDNQVTFKVADNDDGIRSIVRNNADTWEYNSNATYGSETWTAAASNSKFRAFDEAMAVSVNKMTSAQLRGVSDNNHYTIGDTLDLAIVLYQDSVGTPPISDGVSINYDAAALNKGAILGTDYDYDVPNNTSVRITSLKDQNLKVKVV